MNQSHCTDYELLCRLIGRRAANQMYRGALKPLFSEQIVRTEAQRKLAAAWELMQRVIAEEMTVRPALESPHAVKDYLTLLYAGRDHETFTVLFLDSSHRIIVVEDLFRGTLSQTSVYPREVVKLSLQLNAAAVVFAHNHPSGLAEPSRADELLTQSLKNALALIDVRVLDHIVVGAGVTTSFAERGLL